MTRRVLALALLAALALLTACGSDDPAPAPGADRVEVLLDWFPNPDHAGLYGAVDEGFMADEGLTVAPKVPSDPAAALKQVGAGRAPFAISYEAEVILARSQGVPVVAVGALVGTPLNSVIARTDRGITRPRDLEGRTVGAAGLPSDRPLLDTVVRADGGDPGKVRVRNVGYNLVPALASGRVDALIGAYWNIEAPELEAKGVPVAAFRLDRNGVPTYDELVVVTSDAVARDRPETVRALLAGLQRGQDWAAAHPADAAEHLLAANPDLRRSTVERQLRLTAPLLASADGPSVAVHPAQWRRYAAWMRRNGVLTAPVDMDAAVTSRFGPGAPR